MTERPILFSGPMVRAILDGRKTQTRRVMRTNHVGYRAFLRWDGPPHKRAMMACSNGDRDRLESSVFCEDNRYGVTGDRLWVRETWRYHDWTEDGTPWIRYAADDTRRLCERVTPEWAERVSNAWAELSSPENFAIDGKAADRRWRSPRFMPRWASRLTLEVTGVRVDRLHAITEEDARAEGMHRTGGRANLIHDDFRPARDLFSEMWDAINWKRAPWASNPWVWVVEFKRVTEASPAMGVAP